MFTESEAMDPLNSPNYKEEISLAVRGNGPDWMKLSTDWNCLDKGNVRPVGSGTTYGSMGSVVGEKLPFI